MSVGTSELLPIGAQEERAHLLAPFAKSFGAVGSYSDPLYPGYLAVYVETPAGQMSWPVDLDDAWLFDWLPIVTDYPVERHTTRENYERLRTLIAMIPQGVLTYANPRLDTP